jgi:hypothetical protein
MQTGLGSDPNQFRFLVPVKKMMNLHGLIYGIAEAHIGLWFPMLVTLILSAVWILMDCICRLQTRMIPFIRVYAR